ncbi:MAG: alpha/beta hydrolase [Gammaproteobacteria bacterium]|nr:alpha/beta hydrolase [Gammaproteobacteria bacterium]
MTEFAPGMYSALECLRSEAQRASKAIAQNTDQPIMSARERATMTYAYFNQNAPQLESVQDIEAQGADGPRKIRLYRRHVTQELQPVLLYAHGGGWIVGDLNLEDWAIRYMASRSNFCIVSLDYALAPEFQYPKPVRDVTALARWVHDNAAQYGLDKNQIAIGGASAGANLALASAMMLRDDGERWLTSILSFYGVFDMSLGSNSHRKYATDRYSAGSPDMNFFLSLYLQDPSDRESKYINLVDADLSQLPPVHLHAAELDVLRDDSLLIASRLKSSNVSHSCTVHTGAVHGFTVLARDVDIGREALGLGVRQLESEWAGKKMGEQNRG